MRRFRNVQTGVVVRRRDGAKPLPAGWVPVDDEVNPKPAPRKRASAKKKD